MCLPACSRPSNPTTSLPLFERWHDLCQRVGTLKKAERVLLVREVFDDLVARYKAPDRTYHNLDHIRACLLEFDAARSLALEPDAVELAIWFHDAVYDSRRSDNEERSAELAEHAGRGLGVAESLLQSAVNLILVTRHQQAPAEGDPMLMVDIDLSILGQPEAIFDAYEHAIRAEYGWVEQHAFIEGRTQVLRRFLERPRLFGTEHFFARYEDQARRNLQRSLDRLSR
jgi:predicted metal-dependent HD superfamily phosphohydrolase